MMVSRKHRPRSPSRFAPKKSTSFAAVATWGAVFGGCWACQNAFAFAFTKVPKSLLDDRRRRFDDPARKAPPGGNRGEIVHHGKRGGSGSDDIDAVGGASSSWSLSATTAGVEPSADDDDVGARSRGRLLLILVACLYGMLNVALRFVYDVPKVPPTAAALSATRGWLAFLCFLPPLLLQRRSSASTAGASSVAAATDDTDDGDGASSETVRSSPGATATTTTLLRSGLELATWGFLAQGLLNVGLVSTGSARASFLTQTSVLFTPLIATTLGKQRVGRTVWLACCVALVGLAVLTLGGGGGGATAALAVSLSRGDLFVLGGALSWSIYLFRLSALGPKHPDLVLQGVKTGLMAVLYSIWWMGSTAAKAPFFFSWPTAVPSWMASGWIVWAALFFSAVGPGAIADVLQQKGQAHVAPSEANILLSAEPVFATILAVLLLGEGSSPPELAGGALILTAAVMASG